MTMPVYNSLSVQKELEKLLELRSHNLSNAGTEGFLSRDSHIAGYKKKGFDAGVTYAHNTGFYTKTHQGPIHHTGDQMDVAISGDKFLVVGTEKGEALTKAGHLVVRSDGTLTTSNNYPVLDTGGGQMTVPQGTTSINISKDGLISSEAGPLGQMRIVKVNNPETSLTHLTGNLYTTEPENIEEANNTMSLQQYFVTGSNVEPVMELVAIMKIQQQYQKTMGVIGEVSKNGQESTENLLTAPT